MLNALLLLAATLACVSARYTLPIPIHYEIETQLQKQLGNRQMRSDPTNFLTYLAAIYSQCNTLYDSDGSRFSEKGRVPNETAYNNFLRYFDASLLPNNLVVYFWDIESDDQQHVATVDRDIRKLAGKRDGTGALGNLPNLDVATLRNYDRYACSVETACRQSSKPTMALVCVFGTSFAPRQNQDTPQTSRSVVTARTTRRTRPAVTTRTTTAPTTTSTSTTAAPEDNALSGGFYATYREHSQEFYDSIMIDMALTSPGPYDETIIPDEDKINALGLCNFENDASGFTADLLLPDFTDDARPIFFSAPLIPKPSASDLTTLPMTDVAKSAIRSAFSQKQTPDLEASPLSLACAWAMCTEKYVVGCATWNFPTDKKTRS